jgi:hypothetical protein
VGKSASSSLIWVEVGDDLELGPDLEHDAAHHVDRHNCMSRSRSQRTKSSRRLRRRRRSINPWRLRTGEYSSSTERHPTLPWRAGARSAAAPPSGHPAGSRRSSCGRSGGTPKAAGPPRPPSPVLQGSGGRWHPLTLPPRPVLSVTAPSGSSPANRAAALPAGDNRVRPPGNQPSSLAQVVLLTVIPPDPTAPNQTALTRIPGQPDLPRRY